MSAILASSQVIAVTTVMRSVIVSLRRTFGYRAVTLTFHYGRPAGNCTLRVWLKVKHDGHITLATLFEQLQGKRSWDARRRSARDFVDDLVDPRGVLRRGFLIAVNGKQIHSIQTRVRLEDNIDIFVVPAFGGG